MRNDIVPAGITAELDRADRLGHRADLVELDQCRIAGLLLDTLCNEVGIGDEVVVPDDLNPVAESVGDGLVAVPIVLIMAVLDRDDRDVAWQINGFFLTLCGAAAAFVPSAIQGLPDRTLLA